MNWFLFLRGERSCLEDIKHFNIIACTWSHGSRLMLDGEKLPPHFKFIQRNGEITTTSLSYQKFRFSLL